MAVRNIRGIRRMVARLRSDPHVQAMLVRNDFQARGSATMTLDMNKMQDDYRRIVVERWCQARASGHWRRCVVERRGHAILDKIIVEFEHAADATALRDWLQARGW